MEMNDTATLTEALRAFAADHLACLFDDPDGSVSITRSGDLPGPMWDPVDYFADVWMMEDGTIAGLTGTSSGGDVTVTISQTGEVLASHVSENA